MSSSIEELNILNLPPDVIRTIIEVGLEDIDNMMMVSPVWNSLCNEHLENRNHLPMIKFFRWTPIDDENSTYVAKTKLEMHMSSDKYRKFFGLESWKYQQNLNHSSREYWLEITHRGFNVNERRKEKKKISDHIFRIFARSSKIQRLDISNIGNSKDASIILKEALDGRNVDELVYGDIIDYGKMESDIMNLATDGSVKRLHIFKPMLRIYPDTFIPILILLLRVMSQIEISSLELDINFGDLLPGAQPHIQRMDAEEREIYRGFKQRLDGTGQVTTTLHDESRANGNTRFRLIIEAKEQ